MDTDIAIVQPGTNDLRFFGTMQQRAANITEMARRFRARSIKVIVYDEKVPLRCIPSVHSLEAQRPCHDRRRSASASPGHP